ncbi:MAG: ATP-binding cassette domain-containing protein [Faecousia sp.]
MDILIRDISKSYGESRVFSHFSWEIPQGSCCAVMAPSGVGKTTLLRLLLGLEKPDSGQILGVPSSKAALFQEDRLFPRFSALKNIRMAVPGCSREQAETVLSMLGLMDCCDKPVSTLSGGQARRVALARALVHPGELLALDEPFTGLDEASRTKAAEAIRRCRHGRTLILVTHRQEDLPLLEITQRINL